MDQWKLWFVLLTPLCLCFDTEETLVKIIIEGESDVTPICTTAALHTITLIVCKISTKRSRGGECRLLYQYGEKIENRCDSRLRLIKENGTVFLHLTGLTSVDRGRYSCECSYARGTNTLHLDISVGGGEEASFISPTVVGGVTAFITACGVFLGIILRKNHCRDYTRSGSSELSECETSYPVDEDDLNDPYTSLQLRTSDLYQTISSVRHQRDTHTGSASNNIVMAQSHDQEINERETDRSCDAYENIYNKSQDNTPV